MIYMIKARLLYLLFPVLLASCQSGRDPARTTEFEIPDSVIFAESLVISEDIMEGIISNVSSIVEMSALIKGLGVPYSNRYLATTSNLDQYNTNFKRAFNLGVYGADLGYLNMYNRTTAVIDYITAIRRLADGLAVGQFFDFNTLRRLASSQSNLDSLMYISVSSFNQMDQYLRQERRAHLSTAMVAGVWIEGLYLLTQVSKTHPGEEISERIGEQKIILNDLFLILKNYERAHPEFADLTRQLAYIKEDFDKVSITYEIGEPEAIERNGMLMIIQHERSNVNMSAEQLRNITEKAEIIRNKLIQ
jgi:hypothetical protein